VAHAVVDGMGSVRRKTTEGEIGGEHAATIIAKALSERLDNLPADLTVQQARELLSVAVNEAGARVFHELNMSGEIPAELIPEGKSALDVMPAAVMTVLVFCDGGRRAVLSQNGDSRGYLFSRGELILLTEDQDAVEYDVDQGILTPDEALAIQEAVDTFEGYDITKLDPRARSYFVRRHLAFGQVGDSEAPRPPEFSTIQLHPGDVILLCSDGVYSNLTTREIAEGLTAIDPAATLVDRADARSAGRALPNADDPSEPYNYRAHQDDITALVVKISW
jgi:serine/threonine protein phosphatase PrpC